ncbi:MAG: transcription termination factor Rho [Phycisphaeraceae bacterium]|nr:transcription termination factor Rho [Phycisphaeraceae bacterium]
MSQDKTDQEQDTSPEAKDAADAPAATVTEDQPQASDTDGNPKPDGAEASADGEGKPKKRRRRRRKRKSSNGEGAAAAEGQDGGEDLPEETVTGIYEQGPKSDGRLRQLGDTFLAYPKDPVIASHLVEKYDLRPGMMIECSLGKPFGGGQQPNQRGKKKVKYNTIDPSARRVLDIVKIEGQTHEEFGNLRNFADLTIIMPEPRLTLEYPGCPPACRLIDLFCPIGYGTRGMIVSPPKAGKTTLLQNIAMGIQTNHPEIEVYALLIDERPEEVTEFRRNVPCTVWASSNDHTPERHCGLAIAAIERCRRLAEMGKDVVVLMDSLTRLGRAFNTAPNMASTGRTLSGGLDAGAMTIPKQIFGAARKFEEGGSLTIIASALVDTGSRGDQVIFEEFKGTGNMELILDRKIAEQRIFPAIDLAASGTRNEDRLIPKEELTTVNALRRRLLNMNPVMQVEQLLKAIDRFPTNADLVGSPQTNEEAPPRRSQRNNSGLTR